MLRRRHTYCRVAHAGHSRAVVVSAVRRVDVTWMMRVALNLGSRTDCIGHLRIGHVQYAVVITVSERVGKRRFVQLVSSMIDA